MSRMTITIASSILLLNITSMSARAEMIGGQVRKVDRTSQKITIKHGPIKQFDMEEGMTMVFRASDPSLLKGVNPGDKIKFEPNRVNGQFTVEKIEKLK